MSRLPRVQIVFVRHAQPEWFKDGAAVDDPGLTEVGRAQARHLGRRFRAQPADLLLVSPTQRSRETAVPIAEALGIEPRVHDWLHEIKSPAWNGAPMEHVQAIFEAHRDKPIDDHWEGLDGGESFRDFHRRVTHGLQELFETEDNARVHDDPAIWRLVQPERRVIIVAHGGTNASLIGYLLGITPTPWEWERFVSFHASVSNVVPIQVSGNHAYSLFQLSDVSHLPPGIQTR